MSALALLTSLALAAAPEATTATTAPPRVDLMIMGKGGALYSVYGHAALRVIHPDGRDIAYNFGGVNLEVPFFWVTLMRGRIKTYLEVTKYSDLLLQYSGEDRTITGRTLRLTPTQANELVRRLDGIYNSPERYYFYHHVLDNCTTRVAKLLDEVLGGALSGQSTAKVRGTYRDWIIDRVRGWFWIYLAMDLTGNGLGDVAITEWDTTFLPDGLERVIERAKIEGLPFVTSKYVDYRSLNYDEVVIWDWPWTKVYVIFLAPLLALIAWRRRPATFLWGMIAGSIGVVYLLFWLLSDYTFFWRNWNLACFPPTHLLLAVVAARESLWTRFQRAAEIYLWAQAALLLGVGALHSAGLIAQAIHPMLSIAVPVTIALGLSMRPGFRRFWAQFPLTTHPL
jgi:uncharacterized protein DUF4105